jgi:hypothetical protein
MKSSFPIKSSFSEFSFSHRQSGTWSCWSIHRESRVWFPPGKLEGMGHAWSQQPWLGALAHWATILLPGMVRTRCVTCAPSKPLSEMCRLNTDEKSTVWYDRCKDNAQLEIRGARDQSAMEWVWGKCPLKWHYLQNSSDHVGRFCR